MKEKKAKSKKSKNTGVENKRDKLIGIIMLIAIIILIVVVAVLNQKINSEIFEQHSFYQYIGERKINYKGTLKLTRKKAITELKIDDIKIDLDSTPIYYADIDFRLILPQNMAVVYPDSDGAMYKVNSLSDVLKEEEFVYIENGESKIKAKDSFLYDGANLYIFLEDTTVLLNGKEYKVSPLSYAFVDYYGQVELYNKEKDEYIQFDTVEEEVIAKTENYSINMSLDSITCGEKEQLLLKRIDSLKPLE